MVGGTTKEILLEGFGVTPSDSWTHEGKMDVSGVSTVTVAVFFFVLLSVHDFVFNFLALLRLLNNSTRRSFMVFNNLFFSLWCHLFYAVGRTDDGRADGQK